MFTGFEFHLPFGRPLEFRQYASKAGANSLVSFAHDRASGATAAVIGAIYYADDLLAGLPKLDGEATDAEVALTVFRHRGAEGLERIEGEFALVVFDARSRSLIAMRDPQGSWPLYWLRCADGVRVATSMRLLARHAETRVNTDAVAQFLMHPWGGPELAGTATMLDPIRRVESCHLMTLHDNGRIDTRQYWDWADHIPIEPRRVSAEEAASGFLERFRRAINERIRRGSVAAHLSGGMDSSSVVCLARDRLAERSRRLNSVSVLYDMPSLSGETAYIDMILKQGGAIDAHFVKGDGLLDYQWFGPEGIPGYDEPSPAMFRLAMERSLVETAQQTGATTILTGAGSDDLFVGDRTSLADKVSRGRWIHAFHTARSWARSSNRSMLSVFKEYVVEPMLLNAWREGFGTYLRGGVGRWPNLGQFAVPPWVNPAFARTHAMWDKALKVARDSIRFPYEHTARVYWLKYLPGEWTNWYIAAPQGIRNSHPFLDPRVMTFCHALPHEVKDIPGRSKAVLSDAMKGVLPEPIRTRRVKRHYNDVFWKGLAKNLSSLENLVRRSAIRDMQIFQSESLINCMRKHALGNGSPTAGRRIAASLALVAWYDQISKSNSLSTRSERGALPC